MASLDSVQRTLKTILSNYFDRVDLLQVDIHAPLDSLQLGDLWLTEFTFEVEDAFNLVISDYMSRQHFTTLYSASQYLARRVNRE